MYTDVSLFIDGRWTPAAANRALVVLNPATSEAIGKVAHADRSDLDLALDAADKGFKTWRKVSAFDRGKIMRKAGELLRERADKIAQLLTLEQGKPITQAKMETLAGADVIDWFAEEAKRTYGRVIPARAEGIYQLVIKEPIGPVAGFSPWNFPINQAVRKSQVCVSPTRFFVEEAIYDRFANAFAEKAASIKIGNGLDPSTQMGPLANERRLTAMEHLVADAKAKGARVATGGSRIGNQGYYFPLTVLADVPDDALAMREEPFGPLALLSPVKTVDEAIEKANSVPYGLAGYAFTNSAVTAEQLSQQVEVSNLSINHFVASSAETPFGGVKDSGIGRKGGVEGLQCHTIV